MTNHLFIGLGGQGGRTLAELRKVIHQRGADYAAMQGRGVRFDYLAIDSSTDVRNELKCWKSFGTDLSLGSNDWLMLKPPSAANVAGLAQQTDVAPWIGGEQQIRDFVSKAKIEGANQRRRFGRVLFAYNADSIRTALFLQKVPTLLDGAPQRCAFHIFASLAGGTGSGCIIDTITTLRAQFPDASLATGFPIFVYLYLTHDDGRSADVGYFYQNQYSTLRDLNALMCSDGGSSIKLNLLGTQVAGSTFQQTEPIAQLVMTTSVNREQVGVSLPTQIRVVAESCFERISAWSNGQMNAATQQSITGQDVVAGFPGEPLRAPERSYRFAGFGMRRWEVPNRKIEELLALELMASALRQMLYANWQDNAGFSSVLPNLPNAVRSDVVALGEQQIAVHLNSGGKSADWERSLREEVNELARGLQQEQGEENDLSALESRIYQYFNGHFQGTGCPGLVKAMELNQPNNLTEATGQIDRTLTARWLDPGNPVALSHLPELAGALAGSLRTRLEPSSTGSTTQRVTKSIRAREGEWSKITPLAALVGKRKELWTAHTRDCINRCISELRERCDALDQSFTRDMVGRLATLQVAYEAAIEFFTGLLNDTDAERARLAQELQDLTSASGANKYEFDQAALQQFIPAMLAHHDHLSNAALALRNTVHAALGEQPLTVLRGPSPQTSEHLRDQLRTMAMEKARAIHQDFLTRGLIPQIIGASLLRRLYVRFGGDQQLLNSEIKAFVDRAAANLHLEQGQIPPAVLLGRQVGVPEMPRRIFLLGLPATGDAFAAQIKAAFLASGNAGENLKYDTYTHEDSSQLRLLHVDYWLAARFTTVAHQLARAYAGPDGRGPGGDTAYFCNIDPDGEQGKRPDLFLPTPAQMRDRYEAEIWLAQQPPLELVKVDENGVSLMRRDQHGQLDPLNLGSSVENARVSANQGNMFLLHEELLRQVLAIPGDRRKVVADLIESRNQSFGGKETSPEYRRWVDLRKHLQSLAL